MNDRKRCVPVTYVLSSSFVRRNALALRVGQSMDKKKTNWTEEEDQKLRGIYPTQGLQAAIDAFPHRTPGAVRNRVFLLRLRRREI